MSSLIELNVSSNRPLLRLAIDSFEPAALALSFTVRQGLSELLDLLIGFFYENLLSHQERMANPQRSAILVARGTRLSTPAAHLPKLFLSHPLG